MKPNFSDFAGLARLYFQPARGNVYADLAGELAILDSKSGIYYGLDSVGARIWSLLGETKNVAEIRDVLLDEYDVDGGQLETDIAHLFEDLFTKGLIEIAVDGMKGPKKSTAAVSPSR
jgi:hypothetical protein